MCLAQCYFCLFQPGHDWKRFLAAPVYKTFRKIVMSFCCGLHFDSFLRLELETKVVNLHLFKQWSMFFRQGLTFFWNMCDWLVWFFSMVKNIILSESFRVDFFPQFFPIILWLCAIKLNILRWWLCLLLIGMDIICSIIMRKELMSDWCHSSAVTQGDWWLLYWWTAETNI